MKVSLILTIIVFGFFCSILGPCFAEPADQNDHLSVAPLPVLGAIGGFAETVILGAVDPNTEDPEAGFKFQLYLNTKGASIQRAIFSDGDSDGDGKGDGFDDRNYKDPKPLVILSPVQRADDSQIMSMANTAIIFTDYKLQLNLENLDWKVSDVQTETDGSQIVSFGAIINNKTSGEDVVKLIKTYRVTPSTYLLDCTIKVENLSSESQKLRFNLTGPVGIDREGTRSDSRNVVGGFLTPEGKIVSSRKDLFLGFPMNLFSKNVGLKDSTLKYKKALESKDKEKIRIAKNDMRIRRNLSSKHKQASFLWAATSNKYFTAIIRPIPNDNENYCNWLKDQTCIFYNPDGDEKNNTGDETIGLDLKIDTIDLASTGQPDSVKQFSFHIYLGPKDKNLFDKNELYRKLGFFHTVTFMPCCCCPSAIIHPLAFGILASMRWLYTFIPNYGVVIIILVFLIRLVIHPLTKKSQVSMSKMSKLAPMAAEIKEKYANDKAEQQRQMMALYKEHGASPVMGMLPMFVQMPIWIALYSAIGASIALRGAPFLPFWITDLSAPDALVRFSEITIPLVGWKIDSLNLLPILMGVAFYLQQKLMPKQATAQTNPQMAQQQKMMMIMMPLLFPLMLYKAPSGLNLYIMASTFAGVMEQFVIRKHIREKEQAESMGLVAATSKTGGKVKKKKPKPFYKT